MSLHRNGGNSVFICEATGDIIEEDFDPLANGRKSPFSAAFRGFHKVPTVLLSRIDIRPYLKSNGADINKEKIGNIVTKESTDADTSADNNERELLDELSMICKVGVLRDDLEKLKESLKNGTFVDNRLNMLKCKICEKKYQNERKLHNHQENKHMIIYKPEPTKSQKRVSFSDKVIVHELKEYHKCRKCSKIFEDYKSLKVHMKHWHKKRKCYICNYCSKKFIDRMFFKVHMKLHCDTCGLLLPNKKKFNEHKRNVCRILKYHECETCNSVFFKFMDLKDHSYDHTDPSYICDICKDQCPTICAIAHHIKFLHCKNRPTLLYTVISLGNERLYLCNFCDVSSVDRDFIENHTQLLPDLKNRVMTGYEDYYFCDHCFEKFATETDMLQHKWSHFLKTDDTLTKGILTNVHKAQTLKTIYRVGDQIPDSMQPKLVLEKIEIPDEELTEPDSPGNINSFEIEVHDINKPLVDPKSKKTLLSKHQCQTCDKYYSTNYCLNRHIETQHSDYENLRCNVCEETFFWPSLLKSHKCIRLNHPEMPFEDARPEIHFDNLQEFTESSFDDLYIDTNDDYINSVDFEIPAPIVELRENYVSDNFVSSTVNNDVEKSFVTPMGYKVVMHEVPIEF